MDDDAPLRRKDDPFNLAAFLAQPLVARVATRGPSVRPVWYLWERGAFWVITGTWSVMQRHLLEEPSFSLVVDDCNLRTGKVRQVIARGTASVMPMDLELGKRKLGRYLGPREEAWDPRFSLAGDLHARGLRLARLEPEKLIVKDLSYIPAWPTTVSTMER